MIFSFVGSAGGVVVRDSAPVVVDYGRGRCPGVFMRAGHVTGVVMAGGPSSQQHGRAERAVWSLWPRRCERWPERTPIAACAPCPALPSRPPRLGGGTHCRPRTRRTRTLHRPPSAVPFVRADRPRAASPFTPTRSP